MRKKKEDVAQSRGFVLKSGVLDKKSRNVEKKRKFLMDDWKVVRIFVPLYYSA
jgi:hypothetical protein